jgi:beta-lactamase class A
MNTLTTLVLALSLTGASQAFAQAPRPPAGTAGAPHTPAADGADLQRDLRVKTAFHLEEAAVTLDGVLGYAIVDLTDGDTFERLSTQPFPTASTIKLAILYELVKRAGDGTLKLDETITLDRARAVPGGLLYELGTPTLSLRDYANAMVIESDNTATNILITRLGMDAINTRMAALGLDSIKPRRYTIDIDAAKNGLENVASPADLARLLAVFHKGEGLTPANQAEALTILKKGKNTAIRRGVPAGIEIANKPGDLEGVRADTAIVYAKNRPFVIVVMETYLQDENAGEKAIEQIATVACNYFARLGAAAPGTGRRLYR